MSEANFLDNSSSIHTISNTNANNNKNTHLVGIVNVVGESKMIKTSNTNKQQKKSVSVSFHSGEGANHVAVLNESFSSSPHHVLPALTASSPIHSGDASPLIVLPRNKNRNGYKQATTTIPRVFSTNTDDLGSPLPSPTSAEAQKNQNNNNLLPPIAKNVYNPDPSFALPSALKNNNYSPTSASNTHRNRTSSPSSPSMKPMLGTVALALEYEAGKKKSFNTNNTIQNSATTTTATRGLRPQSFSTEDFCGLPPALVPESVGVSGRDTPVEGQQNNNTRSINSNDLLSFNNSCSQNDLMLMSNSSTTRQSNNNDTSSSHGASTFTTGSSSFNNKTEQLTKLLALVPGKEKDELLMKDVDDQQAQQVVHDRQTPSTNPTNQLHDDDRKKMFQLCDDLEDAASLAEKGHRFFEETLDNPFSAVVVISAQNQQIIWVNQFACFMFNLVETDIIGRDVSILMTQVPGRDNKVFHQKKVAHFVNTWSRKGCMPDSKIASGRVQEVVCTRYEGITKQVAFNAQLVVRPVKMSQPDISSPPVAFVGYFRDYSAEKRLKAGLAQSAYITSQCSDPIVSLDFHGTFKTINKAACLLFGYSEKFLVNSEANIKLFIPEHIARHHDRYMKAFREARRTPGFEIATSPIVHKERSLTARRADGTEIPVILRVEVQLDPTNSGNDRLIGYFRDRRALIKSSDFNLEVSKRIFPESIAKIVSQKSDIRLVETYKNIPVVLIDIVDFQNTVKAMDNESIADLLSTFFKQIAELAAGFQVEVVKSNADGMICVNGIDEFDERKSRMDRAVAFALSLLRWTQENERRVRIGIGYGELGSAVFEISKGRPTWDVWASAINESSRMEKNAEPQTLQITQNAYKTLHEEELRALFRQKEYSEGIDGMQDTGNALMTYQTSAMLDHRRTVDITNKIKNASMSRVYLKKENARQLKEQQERRALTQA